MAKEDSSPPNVILIMCDQWRHDVFGHMGHPLVRTPHLDALAAGGVVFENAYCASPVCSPSRGSWLTGAFPHAHGQIINDSPKSAGRPGSKLRRDSSTLGDYFKEAGYHCGLVGHWHLGDGHEPQHGFEEYWDSDEGPKADGPDRFATYFEEIGVVNMYNRSLPAEERGVKGKKDIKIMSYGAYTDPRQQRTTFTVDRGLAYLEAHAGMKEPFFLFLSIKDPHPVIVAPPELLELYPPEEIEMPATWGDPLEGKPACQQGVKGRLPRDTKEEAYRNMAAHHYALVTHVDRQIGRVVAALEEAGIRENTVVAFVADHGEMLGDHGFVAKRVFYERSVKVPWILSWPGTLSSEQRIQTPVSAVDLVPTLLELAGASPPAQTDGRSLADALLDRREPTARPVLSQIATIQGPRECTEDVALNPAHVMVRDADWKYVWHRCDIGELYDLANDPDEMTNLAEAPDQAGRVEHMRGLIGEIVQQTGPGSYAWCLETAGGG